MKNKTPIVIELHDDGFVKVYATEQRPDVSIVIVNRPYSEHDIDDAGVATSRSVGMPIGWNASKLTDWNCRLWTQ